MLTFDTPPDYETPADANRDNLYAVTIETGTTDYTPRAVTIAVTNVTVMTRAPHIQYAENGTGAVATYTYNGPESPTWAVGGADAAAFSISATGVLTFDTPPDYETPTDADGDNIYAVTIQAGTTADTQFAATVTVTNVTGVKGPSDIRHPENSTRGGHLHSRRVIHVDRGGGRRGPLLHQQRGGAHLQYPARL